MQCYNNYCMHVAEQIAVKAFLHLTKQLTLVPFTHCKGFQHYKVPEMNVSTASSNSFSITP